MISDACFIIDLLAKDDAAVAKLEELTHRLLAVPTLVYSEVGGGLEARSETSQRFDSIMDEVQMVPYDAEAARRAVDFQRDLSARGEPIGAVEAMIAGTAVARDEPIVTRNASEFARTPARVSPY